jgi:hypothetical protein
MDGNTDSERKVKTRINLKSNGCLSGHIKSCPNTWIKRSEQILFDVKGENRRYKSIRPWK